MMIVSKIRETVLQALEHLLGDSLPLLISR